MSTNSTVACTTLRLALITASSSTRWSGTWATPTVVSVVENGMGGDDGGPAGEGVEEARLARVRQPHDAQSFHRSKATRGDLGTGIQPGKELGGRLAAAAALA